MLQTGGVRDENVFFGSAEVAGAGDVLQGGLRAADFQHAYGRTDWLK